MCYYPYNNVRPNEVWPTLFGASCSVSPRRRCCSLQRPQVSPEAPSIAARRQAVRQSGSQQPGELTTTTTTTAAAAAAAAAGAAAAAAVGGSSPFHALHVETEQVLLQPIATILPQPACCSPHCPRAMTLDWEGSSQTTVWTTLVDKEWVYVTLICCLTTPRQRGEGDNVNLMYPGNVTCISSTNICFNVLTSAN